MEALRAPLTAIIENSGKSAPDTIRTLEEGKREAKSASARTWLGFNAVTNKVEDLKRTGIIDPLKVTKTAFLNAVSIAASYLTIGAAIADIPKKEEPGHPGGGGMPGGMDY